MNSLGSGLGARSYPEEWSQTTNHFALINNCLEAYFTGDKVTLAELLPDDVSIQLQIRSGSHFCTKFDPTDELSKAIDPLHQKASFIAKFVMRRYERWGSFQRSIEGLPVPSRESKAETTCYLAKIGSDMIVDEERAISSERFTFSIADQAGISKITSISIDIF